MTPFHYSRASDVADAISQIAADPAAKFIAGGTNLIDLMKYDVEHPARLIDISQLPLKNVEETPDGLRVRSWPARRSSCATWHRPEGTSCSARGVFTSTMP